MGSDNTAILAKPDETLERHTENVLSVFKSVREGFPDMPFIAQEPHLFRNVFLACFLHDFGKATPGFQRQLVEEGYYWGYRHEILSASFVSVLNLPYEDKKNIALAVITHHKSLNYLIDRYSTLDKGPGYARFVKEREFLMKDKLNKLLLMLPSLSAEYLGESFNDFHLVSDVNELTDPFAYISEYVRDAYKVNGVKEKMYKIFLKGVLTASDHLASAGIYAIKKGLKDIDIKKERLFPIQEKAKEVKGNLFILSPTGSGKTEAALLWSASNQNREASKRTFYILPYTASANAMYERLANLLGEDEVGILHYRSEMFMYDLLSASADDKGEGEKFREAFNKESLNRKIYKPYKIVTPFQLIKAFYGVRGFERTITEMTDGLFIFDEIHAYDPKTVALITEMSKFLKDKLNGRFLFMTATMPSFLKDIIKKETDTFNEVRNQDVEKFNRHKINVVEGKIEDKLLDIRKALEENLKVLVVANTVEEAQRLYRELRPFATSAVLIHSRFIQKDRAEAERRVKEENVQLLVGTQAIEISLDIDYDILFTEPAPIDALIQRFGRVNRNGKKGISDVYLFTEGSGIGKIYNEDTVKKTIALIKAYDGSVFPQKDVQSIVDRVYSGGYTGRDLSVFNETKNNFHIIMEEDLTPFMDNKLDEKYFYSMFDGIDAVPVEFEREVRENPLFISKYSISLPGWLFSLLMHEGRIEYGSLGKKKDLILVDAKYDTVNGLNYKESAVERFL